MKYSNAPLILAILIFLFLYLPFFGLIPYRDGNIDFIQSYNFYQGGFNEYFENWSTVHPPFKIALQKLLFSVFGLNTSSYSLLGLGFGLTGIISLYLLNKALFNKEVAGLSAVLLSSSPLFLATGIFGLSDYLVTSLILLSLYLYISKKTLLFVLSASAAVLAKETALLLPIAALLVEIIHSRGKLKNLKGLLFPLLPLVIFGFWSFFLKLNGKSSWGDYIFAETKSQGTFLTIINNILTFGFLNKYAYQHWLQLFLLNFNWVFWLVILLGILLNIKNLKKILKQRSFLVITIFCFSYLVTVLGLQTYTIPRYGLPLIPFMLTGVALTMSYLIKKSLYLGLVVTFCIVSIIPVSLFFSLDPVSERVWGKNKVLGEEIYALNKTLAGNDGITYNMQYLKMARKRSTAITNASAGSFKPDRSLPCQEVFADPNNDNRMVKILKLEEGNITSYFPCRFEAR